ncbi:MAG: hypothetical protein ACI88C_000078 [Acidimicrobiales bacterium]|jgi:hypothetical protein
MLNKELLKGLEPDRASSIEAAFEAQRNYYEDGIKQAAIAANADADGVVGLAQLHCISDLIEAQTRLRDDLLKFASGMEGQLRGNVHKGGSWPEINCSVHLDHAAVQCSAAGRALIDGRKTDARRHFTNAANYIFFACTVST